MVQGGRVIRRAFRSLALLVLFAVLVTVGALNDLLQIVEDDE
jgi:hypothetical protein